MLWSYWAGERVPGVYVLWLSPVVTKGRCEFWRGTVRGGRARGADRSLARRGEPAPRRSARRCPLGAAGWGSSSGCLRAGNPGAAGQKGQPEGTPAGFAFHLSPPAPPQPRRCRTEPPPPPCPLTPPLPIPWVSSVLHHCSPSPRAGGSPARVVFSCPAPRARPRTPWSSAGGRCQARSSGKCKEIRNDPPDAPPGPHAAQFTISLPLQDPSSPQRRVKAATIKQPL